MDERITFKRSARMSGILVKQYVLDMKKELFRKSIHLCTAFIPLLLKLNYVPVMILLFLALICYCTAEYFRLKGTSVPLISAITAAAARKRDENKFVLGPVTLVIGIIITALLWNPIPATVGIFALAFGDGLASPVGKIFGSVRIPFSKGKTVAGSLACFTAIFISCFCVTRHTILALIIAFCGMMIEVLPLKDLDNLIIPIALGGFTQYLLPLFSLL